MAVFAGSLPTLEAAVPAPMRAYVEDWCIDCHDADSNKGGLNFEALDFANDPAAHARWVRVFDQVLSGEMPPAKKPRADETARRGFLTALGQGLLTQHSAMKGTVLRRLNRSEYENTLRDLLGMRVEVRDLLPEDSISRGFDNIGEALSMSDVQLARYMEAAEFALNTALQKVTQPETKKVVCDYKGGVERAFAWLQREDGAVVFFNNGVEPDTTLKSFRAPSEGKYRFRVSGYAYQSTEPVAFAVHAGSVGRPSDLVGYYEVGPGAAQTVSLEVWLRMGETVKISPDVGVNMEVLKKVGRAAYPGKGLAVQGVEVEGPIFETWPPRAVTLLFGDLARGAKEMDEKAFRDSKLKLRPIIEVSSSNPDGDAARLLRGFAAAAFRRPVDEAKVAPYVELFRSQTRKGSSFSVAMRSAAVAILCSPDFLYLREPAGKLDDFALATRLSYFLWRTSPDDELLRIAGSGRLRDLATLRAQTDRLLSHSNSERFVADFTDGWLNLRDIDFTSPDRKLYPEFDGQLQDAMVGESRGFFRELIKANLSPLNIVQSDFAMLNRRLAEHYAIPGVTSSEIQNVKLPPDSKRGGVLTQGAVLKVSANGTTTSPVTRGAWVLERILGTPPQPPPPGTPGLEPDSRGGTTLREQLAKHRSLESCNGCHRVIDPPGFALESYDVIGGWREKFRVIKKKKVNLTAGKPVDCTGELADGTKFSNFADYQKLLLAKPERITKNIAEKLLTFASGRELGFSDRNELNRIVTELSTKKGGMRDLVYLVVGSGIFQSE